MSVGLRLEESWLRELLQNAARDESSIVELAEIVDPINFGETHGEGVAALLEISHVVQEVKDGEISAENGLREIKEAIEAAERAEDEGEEEGSHLPKMVIEIIAQVEADSLTPGKQ